MNVWLDREWVELFWSRWGLGFILCEHQWVEMRTHTWECVHCVTVGYWLAPYKLWASITDTIIPSDLYLLLTIILMDLFMLDSDNVIFVPGRTLQQSGFQVEKDNNP